MSPGPPGEVPGLVRGGRRSEGRVRVRVRAASLPGSASCWEAPRAGENKAQGPGLLAGLCLLVPGSG